MQFTFCFKHTSNRHCRSQGSILFYTYLSVSLINFAIICAVIILVVSSEVPLSHVQITFSGVALVTVTKSIENACARYSFCYSESLQDCGKGKGLPVTINGCKMVDGCSRWHILSNGVAYNYCVARQGNSAD
jgi:hypothetical protein